MTSNNKNKQIMGAFACHAGNAGKTTLISMNRLAWRNSVARMVTHLWRGRTAGQKQRQGGTSRGVRQMDEWVLTLAELLIAEAISVRAPVSSRPSPPTSASEKTRRWVACVHLGLCCRVQLINSHRFRAVIITLKRCNYRRGWQCESSFILERWLFFFTSCASSHLSLFSSINRLLTDCTKLWKSERKF